MVVAPVTNLVIVVPSARPGPDITVPTFIVPEAEAELGFKLLIDISLVAPTTEPESIVAVVITAGIPIFLDGVFILAIKGLETTL